MTWEQAENLNVSCLSQSSFLGLYDFCSYLLVLNDIIKTKRSEFIEQGLRVSFPVSGTASRDSFLILETATICHFTIFQEAFEPTSND